MHCLKYILIYFLFGLVTVSAAQKERILDYAAEDTVVVTAERNRTFFQTSAIGTKLPASLAKTPMSIGTVSQAINRDQNNFELSSSLNNLSGVNSQTGFGIHDYFTVRGFSSLDNGLILTDGTPEPEVMIYNLYNIERIDLLKGPGAFLYGSNPLAGTINLGRKKPDFRNFTAVQFSGGSFGTYRGTIDGELSNARRTLSLRTNAVWQQSDGYREDKANQVGGINPSLTWVIDDESLLNANVEYLKSSYKPDSGLPLLFNPTTNQLDLVAEVEPTVSFQTQQDYSDQEIVRVKLDFERQVDSVSVVKNRFYYTLLDWNTAGTLLNGAYPTQYGFSAVSRTMQFLDDRQSFLGNQTELSTRWRTGPLVHDFLLGLEVTWTSDIFDIDIVPQLPTLNLSDPVETYDPSLYPEFYYMSRQAKSIIVAPYALDVITFGKATIFAGGRLDRITFREKYTDIRKQYHNFSPMAGISYELVDNFTVYANSGSAFAPPSTRTDGLRDPEKSRQAEAGLKNSWLGNRIHSTLAVYRIEKENIAIPDKNGLARQIGSQLSRGIEFEVQARMTQHCASIFSYAYTETELTRFHENVPVGQDEYGGTIYMLIDRSGNEAAFAPRHMITFWHSREFMQKFGFGLGVSYRSRQFIAENNVFAIDGYTTFDGMLYYKMGRMRWSLNGRNLSDTSYYMRGFGNSSVIPAPTRAVYGSLEFQL